MPRYVAHLQSFGKMGIAKKNDSKIMGKLTNIGVPCMMLVYVTNNAAGTYRLLNVETNNVFKSRNVRWIEQSYGEYFKSKQDVEDTDDDDDSEKESLPFMNQGATTAPVSSPSRPIIDQEGSKVDPVSSRTRSKAPSGNLAQELEDLEISFFSAKQKLLAQNSFLSVYEMIHGLMALVGGTDTTKSVPLTFREAWDH